MSKNIVDCVCDLTSENIGLIPSRRQIEFDGGYVNNWKTIDFSTYIRAKNPSVTIQRDHGGPHQGKQVDDGIRSFREDILSGFDLIHIDPWKKTKDIEKGIEETVELINYCLSVDDNCKFEIGTEQAIRKFSSQELDYVFGGIKKRLGSNFDNIVYGVIQGGTSILGTKNTGVFDKTRFHEMIGVCKKYNLLSKEHNGDYLSPEGVRSRFDLGLDAINIAPEFGFIESRTIMEEIYNNQSEDLFEEFFRLCYDSGKWKKWVDKNFSLTNFKKHVIIRVCGHYVFSDPRMSDIKSCLPNIDNKIKENLNKRILEVLCSTK